MAGAVRVGVEEGERLLARPEHIARLVGLLGGRDGAEDARWLSPRRRASPRARSASRCRRNSRSSSASPPRAARGSSELREREVVTASGGAASTRASSRNESTLTPRSGDLRAARHRPRPCQPLRPCPRRLGRRVVSRASRRNPARRSRLASVVRLRAGTLAAESRARTCCA